MCYVMKTLLMNINCPLHTILFILCVHVTPLGNLIQVGSCIELYPLNRYRRYSSVNCCKVDNRSWS